MLDRACSLLLTNTAFATNKDPVQGLLIQDVLESWLEGWKVVIRNVRHGVTRGCGNGKKVCYVFVQSPPSLIDSLPPITTFTWPNTLAMATPYFIFKRVMNGWIKRNCSIHGIIECRYWSLKVPVPLFIPRKPTLDFACFTTTMDIFVYH